MKDKLLGCFGQVVFGPPGSGKSTYTNEALRVLSTSRKPVLINLDPAVEFTVWDKAGTDVIDIRDLITTSDAAKVARLGPNASFLFCMNFLDSNTGREWLLSNLVKRKEEGAYFLFDLPGQVELVMHHAALRNVLQFLVNDHGLRLMAVHLVDSLCATDAVRFMSVAMLSLSSMMFLALPQINVLTKADLLSHDALDFPLDFYTRSPDFSKLALHISQQQKTKTKRVSSQFLALCESTCQLLDGFQLVAFQLVSVRHDPDSLVSLLEACDIGCGWRV